MRMSYYGVFWVLALYVTITCGFRWRLNSMNEVLNSFHNSETEQNQHIYGVRPNVKSDTNDTVVFVDQYYSQKLDHSRPTDQTEWPHRYFINDLFYEKDGPMFLMVSGEGEANASRWMRNTPWISYARKFNAMCFLLEHRYYGKSRPKEDTRTENLVHLTTEQELADVVSFIEGMNTRYNLSANTKWILFGGSYAGNLVAWARMKYPNVIYGAISSSAPVLAQTDFPEYLEVVKNSLATHSSQCVENVAIANQQLRSAIKSKTGRFMISKLFKLCRPLKRNVNDISSLAEMLADSIAYAVQYNRKIFSINEVCTIMNEKKSYPLKRYAKLAKKFYLELGKETCLSHEYAEMIKELGNTNYSTYQSSRLWVYQTCTEYGYYQTSNKKTDLFGDLFRLDFFIKICKDLFGSQFNKKFIDDAVNWTNLQFGGRNFNASNVVFIHGPVDPWHALGITEKTKNAAYDVLYINGTAHCADMYPTTDEDIEGLKAARTQIRDVLNFWIAKSEDENKNNTMIMQINSQTHSFNISN